MDEGTKGEGGERVEEETEGPEQGALRHALVDWSYDNK